MSNAPGFLDSADYPFVEILERNASIIRAEVERLVPMHRFVPSRHRFVPLGGKEALAKMVYEKGWDVFALYRFGKVIPGNAALCPRTTRIIEEVPEILTGGFSKLAPGTHIRPHAGKQDLVRCHLGLLIPEQCRFRVGGETRRWEEGRCLLFDNTVEHEAWNDSDRLRIVLVVDFLKRT